MIFNNFRDQIAIKSAVRYQYQKSAQPPAIFVVIPKIAENGGKNVLKRTHFIFPPATEGRWPTPAPRGVGLVQNSAFRKDYGY